MAKQKSPSVFAYFAELQDPRIERTKAHSLMNVIFIALCAVVSGANDFVAMEKFGKSKRPWLEKYLALPNGTPSHDTFGRVFSAIESEKFVACFLSWVEGIK